jgi:serine/threonine-protein kinase
MSSSSRQTAYCSGQPVIGKWNNHQYRIIRQLGSGANGQVYLVESKERLFALKLATQANDLALEYQILLDVYSLTQENPIGPKVYELDDWEDRGIRQYFFVMEYVRGTTLSQFVSERGSNWVPVLISQLLRNIHILHEKGFAFGDLKAENCLVDPNTGTVRLIDFGGVTPFGKGIRQYTEWYDRAWWGQGSRRADAGYDMFAIAMIVVRLLMPQLYQKIEAMMHQYQGPELWGYLQKSIEGYRKADPNLVLWTPIVSKVWKVEYASLREMRNDVLECMKATTAQASKHSKTKTGKRTRDWTDYWVWIMLAGSFTLFLFFYFYGP